MTKQHKFSAWLDAPGGWRFAMEGLDEDAWISCVDADRLLASCSTPIQPPRAFLAHRASIRSLTSKARVIVESYPDGSQARFEQMPIVEEWEMPAWSSPFADMWDDGQMRLPGANGSTLEYVDVAFDRKTVMQIASRYSAAPSPSASSPAKNATLPAPSPTASDGAIRRKVERYLASPPDPLPSQKTIARSIQSELAPATASRERIIAVVKELSGTRRPGPR